MTVSLTLAVVVLAGLYLAGLGVAAFVLPAQTARFLLGFAGSAFTHYLELGIRLIVGGAFVVHSPHTPYPVPFAFFGWVLVATTAVLLFVPWQLHRRFAERSVPRAIRYLTLLGVASFVFGSMILWASLRGAV